MKTTFYIILALLAGLALGSWTVKSDLRKARKEIASFKDQMSQRGQRQESIRSITSMLRVPEPPSRQEPTAPVAATNTPSVSVEVTTNAAPQTKSDRETFREGIKTAMDAWKTRSALARDGFLSNINASPVQTQMFDKSIEAMNKELGDKIQQWTDYLKTQKEVSAETGLRMMNDLSGTIVKSYDELDRVLSPGWRDQAGEQFQLFDFINPEVALPLADAESLPSFHGRRRHRP
jgi:hypothetical protein